ncbi:hypothetical protein ACQPXB_35990 [Amycolatopsis sp. CA-161197]|uniref:hypothetical protein n=1 Tax=Amycolatopsis sp. CA-161197 TaxID=3239922 RepID=UPI003D944283
MHDHLSFGQVAHAATVWGIDADVFAGWGQWAGAIASVLAVLVALGLAARETRLRDRERRDEERAQARTVTAVLAERSHYITWAGKVASVPRQTVVLSNHGRDAVLEVEIEAVSPKSTAVKADLDGARRLAILGPGVEENVAVSFKKDDEGVKMDPSYVEIAFSFTDVRGRRWRRIRNGEPQRILT